MLILQRYIHNCLDTFINRKFLTHSYKSYLWISLLNFHQGFYKQIFLLMLLKVNSMYFNMVQVIFACVEFFESDKRIQWPR